MHYTRAGQWQPVGLSPFCKAPWPPVKDSVSESECESESERFCKAPCEGSKKIWVGVEKTFTLLRIL